MRFKHGGGWEDEEEEWGWMVAVRGGGVIAPDAHTPTPTNYHCAIENKEEVKTEATQTQRYTGCPFLSTETEKN